MRPHPRFSEGQRVTIAAYCAVLLAPVVLTSCAPAHSTPELGPELRGHLLDAMSDASAWGRTWDEQHCDEALEAPPLDCRERLRAGKDVAEEVYVLFDGLRHHALQTNDSREIARVAGLAVKSVDQWLALGCETRAAPDCVGTAFDAATYLVALSDAAEFADPSEW